MSPDSQDSKDELHKPTTQVNLFETCQVVLDFHYQLKDLGGYGTAVTEDDREYTFAQFRKTKPPTYDGKSNPLFVRHWIRKMERIFRAERVPKIKRLTLPSITQRAKLSIGGKRIDPPQEAGMRQFLGKTLQMPSTS